MKTIDNDIKRQEFKKVYLLYGEERYLIRQYRDKLKNALASPDDTMNFSSFEGDDINVKEIIDLADGVMVARGDLGVECPIESVPTLQRRIVESCRRAGKPVIVATQMLESMISSPMPMFPHAGASANSPLSSQPCCCAWR